MFDIYRIYYSFLFRYKWRFLTFLIIISLAAIAENVQPYFYKLFVEAIPSSNFSLLIKILVFYIAIRFITLIFDNLTYLTGDWVVFPAARDARLAVFKKIQELDFAFHLSKSTGSLISAMKRGDNAFFDLHHSINIRLVQILVGFIVVLVFFFRLNPPIAFLMLISFVLNLIFARFLIKHNMKTRQVFNQEEDRISDTIVDNLINFETVKLFAKEGWEYKRLQSNFVDWLKALWSYATSFRIIDIVVGTSANIGLFFILLYGLNELVSSRFSTGDYVMVLGFIGSFYPRFFEIIYEFRNLAKHHVDIQKYFIILKNDTLVKDPESPISEINIKGNIEFKNVSFSYPDGKKGAVKNINLKIPSGQSIAFVGHSGVGKTTLIKLLMRFYDPTKGEILLDGNNINKFTKSQLRSYMGVVPQEPVLFNNTIGFNIAYGSDEVTKEQITSAAKIANLYEFINSLPAKFETQVGERGVKLSGGQKQRLAIARMILSNPDIIIFDEATSQLDSESEKQIQDAFWKSVKNKTTLIIAHRLSTIIKADKIVVMKHGKIAEIGSHYELINKDNSIYSQFWQLQSVS